MWSFYVKEAREGGHFNENKFITPINGIAHCITGLHPRSPLRTSLTNRKVLLPKLKVFDNRVLRRIFGPNRDEVTGEWRKLHNEELNDL
jgi:hypothetical protein